MAEYFCTLASKNRRWSSLIPVHKLVYRGNKINFVAGIIGFFVEYSTIWKYSFHCHNVKCLRKAGGKYISEGGRKFLFRSEGKGYYLEAEDGCGIITGGFAAAGRRGRRVGKSCVQ